MKVAPPPELVVDLDAWRQLAQRLQGRLTVGDLSIEGELDQMPVEIELQWNEARPRAVRAHVGHPANASEAARNVELTLACPAADARSGQATERLADQLARWPSDFADLTVADGVASASLVIADGAADAARVRELVQALRALIAALEPAKGPYR